MKPEELTNYCKNNLGIDLVYYSGKNSMECAKFVDDYHLEIGRENGSIYLNFPKKNVYLHDDEYIIRYKKRRFLYTHRCELQRVIDLCHHIEKPDGSYCEVIVCPNKKDYMKSELLYTLIDWLNLDLSPELFQTRDCYKFHDYNAHKDCVFKPGDLFIIKPDGYSIIKEEDIPMSSLEEDSFKEECEIWSDYDAEDLNCIATHGMTCGEYQALLEEIEEEEKNRLMWIKESHEAIWGLEEELW